MGVTRLFNKITLREHPDLSPVADPSFEKGHAFIFPEDEVVFCTQITAPDDISNDFSGVTLQSVKCSILAKKPNIFSSEFSRIFTSTRSFDLDALVLPLNNSNAPSVPWGAAGVDGYAPNINYTQDRNWQLKSGDFKRQTKFFTTHEDSTSVWKWNFWWPIIFREEYWLALKAADNDFYNPAQPQNGKNQKWLNYHNPGFVPFGWLIKYRFELKYQKAGDTNVIYSELNLSNEQEAINDYNSNTDYPLRTIKTCKVGGTPINVPFAPIFGDKNTECFAYFTKATDWEANEKGNLIAVFRIRPEESGDQAAWNSASEKYPLQASDVWVSKKQYINTNSGLHITTAGGQRIVTSQSEVGGCTLSFDPLDDKKITVKAQIDYVKLKLKYPGVTKFTLFCRLYNGTIYTT